MAAPKQTVPSKCLECHAELKTPVVCEKCYSLYPVPATVDFFGLFQLPRGYDLETQEVERRFLSLSRSIHPDFFTTQPPEVRQMSVRLSAEINEAYRVLKNPVLRAEYLLELAGGESAAADKSVPAEFLGEVMLLREEIEDALAGDDQPAIVRHQESTARRHAQLQERIASLARKLPEAKYAEMLELRQLLNSMKYLDSILKLF
ncbi:MAG: Fe-S protein assembly co-chaperone HscB [bacterium]|nr:Fe-S protein assembly co-chaperone HscB [bacterium]